MDITKDVTEAIVDYEPAKPYPIRKTETENCEAKAEKFAKYINGAQRPVIQVGGGVIASESYREVMELAEKADIPMVTTLMGMGAIPSSDERYFGMIGRKSRSQPVDPADKKVERREADDCKRG